jgi:hypothetical protein
MPRYRDITPAISVARLRVPRYEGVLYLACRGFAWVQLSQYTTPRIEITAPCYSTYQQTRPQFSISSTLYTHRHI